MGGLDIFKWDIQFVVFVDFSKVDVSFIFDR